MALASFELDKWRHFVCALRQQVWRSFLSCTFLFKVRWSESQRWGCHVISCDLFVSSCLMHLLCFFLLFFASFCFLCSRTYAMPSRCTAGRQNPRSPEHVLEHINFSTNLLLRNKFPKVLKTSNFWVLKTWGHGALGENQIQWRGGWVNPHVKSNGAKK